MMLLMYIYTYIDNIYIYLRKNVYIYTKIHLYTVLEMFFAQRHCYITGIARIFFWGWIFDEVVSDDRKPVLYVKKAA